MKKILTSALTVALVLLMAACSSNSNGDYPYSAKYLPVVLEGSQKWSILDVESGDVVAKDAFKAAPSAVVNDMFFVQNDNGTFDYYNVSDVKKPVNKTSYGSATEFSDEGLAAASIPGEAIAIINNKCEKVVTLSDSIVECSNFCRGMAVVRYSNGLCGYINTEGKTVVAGEYEQVSPFLFCDLAIAQNRRMVNDSTAIVDFSFIDKAGKVTFSSNSTVFTLVAPNFKADVIPATSSSKPDTVVCLNSLGQEVANPFEAPEAVKKGNYDSATADGAGNFVVSKGDKVGVVDKAGKIVLNVKYFDIIDITADRYMVSEKQGIYFLVDKKGNPVGKLKVSHANGTPGATAKSGIINMDSAVNSLLQMIDERGCVVMGPQGPMPVAKGVTAQNFFQAADTSMVGKNGFAMGSTYIGFSAAIASKDAAGNAVLNGTVPVQYVSNNLPLYSFAKDTEEKLVKVLGLNMGKKGFVNVGNNVYESENGTAVAIGYKDGVLMLDYFMNKADAKPLPTVARK